MIIVLSIVGLLLISPAIFASVSTVSTSMSTSRATTGTSVTGTVTVTATGTESGSVQLSCSPSGVTISDPSTGQYQGVSLSTSPTSKTFTFTAGTANTYTCTGQSSGVTGDATIVFVDPSSLTVTGTPASKTGIKTGTFLLSVNIQNSQSNAITTSYSLSCGSHTCSGDSTSDTITVSAGTTTALSWTVTIGGTSSSSSITFSLGDTTNAFSTSITCSDCATTTTTTTDTTTTTTSGTTPTTRTTTVSTEKGKATITIPSIAAGKSEVVAISKTEDVAFKQIEIFVKNTVNTIQITVSKLADKPASVTQEITGKVYHYIEVKTNVTDIDTKVNQSAIRFEVSKTWLTENNIDDTKVSLNRYENNAWNKLTTTKMSDDGTNVLYEAISPGLSVFAISGEVKTTTTTPSTEQPSGGQNVTQAPSPTEFVEKNWILLVIIVVVAIAGVIFYLVKAGIIPLGKPGWDDLKRKYKK